MSLATVRRAWLSTYHNFVGFVNSHIFYILNFMSYGDRLVVKNVCVDYRTMLPLRGSTIGYTFIPVWGILLPLDLDGF